ncbi:hypothetical protein J7T55_011263 [Diaporthe amygdali]|uniref:uncharacterized protein n=1 Tax=Phomopsis amygdali TaxID=1214568 RepID=UPI0022FDF3D2|nr:uncharacterized protein J7T55_011263 [Diaporthe amygdali]KAJ0108772.1 hypothetical protein J7T55_011263 [Diaporthe amygdali]
MEEFLVQNAKRYQSLVKAFRPGASTQTSIESKSSTSPDIVVSTRIRPLLDEEDAAGFSESVFPRDAQPGVVDVHELRRTVRGLPTLTSSNYQVDRVFGSDAKTEDVYDVVSHLVPFACSGGIGTLFAYGQTGSGKTFTVSGLEKMVVKALMEGDLHKSRKIFITIIELAGNSSYDLLNSRKPISILEDSFGVTQLAGAQEYEAKSTNDVLGLIETATSFRRTQSTQKNDVSSRSHAICRVRIEKAADETSEDGILYLIDLAGSEAARDMASHGADRMKETREINASLSVLKDCIRGKVEADALAAVSLTASKSERMKMKKPHVPFRQSALTKVLKHVFDPVGTRNCKTVVIACVNPSIVDVGASKNTLRYAEMLRVLVPNAKPAAYNPAVPATWSNKQLKEWVDNNSGSPPIQSSVLAPTETGPQLLRLPAPEFEARCMKTPGMNIEQAKAFRSKLWQLHIDSQRALQQSDAPSAAESEEPDTILGHLTMAERSSSREVDPKLSILPFKDRIRPGTVVSWTPPANFPLGLPGGMNMVLVLCPAEAAGEAAKTVFGSQANSPASGEDNEMATGSGKAKRYLCALIVPGLMSETYEVNLWRQIVVDTEAMNAEICLEYDPATRYYYMAV